MRLLSLLLLALSLVACKQPSENTLVIGTIAGPETELIETARQVAKQKYGLNIKIVEFSDYNLPNEALQDGSLDANVFQHLPYLKASMRAHGYTLEPIGKTFVYPTGIYSQKYHKLAEIPENAVIALPNDPSNEARALILLQNAGLISLKGSYNAGPADIANNPKHLQFKEIDAAQLPRVLPDVDAAVINTNFAIPAGLSPSKDALFKENKNSPYANIVVIKIGSKKEAQLMDFVKALNSEEVEEKAKSLFGNAAIPAWK